jgi:hypothetical protein
MNNGELINGIIEKLVDLFLMAYKKSQLPLPITMKMVETVYKQRRKKLDKTILATLTKTILIAYKNNRLTLKQTKLAFVTVYNFKKGFSLPILAHLIPEISFIIYRIIKGLGGEE